MKHENTTEYNRNLQELEDLLVRSDQMYKEAASNLIEYTREFGDMIVANFELKIACIEQKKAISYCRRRINRGLPIDVTKMQAELEQEMKLYRVQLEELVKETDEAKKAEAVDQYTSSRVKKIYRRLAKLLHPDINKKTQDSEELQDLWTRIVKAYRASNVEELEDLEVLARKAMESLGEDAYEVEYDDLERRIERVERQINEILTTEPYTYGEMLRDEEKKEAHRRQLEDERDDFEQYLAMLTKTIGEILQGGRMEIVLQTE